MGNTHQDLNTSYVSASSFVSSLYGDENVKDLFKEILASAIPTTVGALMVFLKETINLIFIGHLNDPVKLASVGMGDIIRLLVGVGVVYGLNTSLEI